MFQFHPILIPFIFSASVAAMLAWASWRQRYRPQAPYFTVFMLCLLIWVGGFVFEIAAIPFELKLVLANLQFIGIDAGPVAFLALTLSYTGKIRQYKNAVMFLYFVPVVDQIVIWTDPWHHLYRNTPHLDTTSASFPILVADYSLWYYVVELPFIYIVFAVSVYQMVVTIRNSHGAFRNQVVLLLIGFFLMISLQMAYVLGFSPIPNFNITSIPFSLSGGLLFWGMQRYRFLDVMPIARSMIIETLNDPWFVLDQSGRLVDLNPAAGLLVGVSPDQALGLRVEAVLAKFPDLLSYLDKADPGYLSNEVGLAENNHQKIYDVRLFSLLDRRDKPIGTLLMLQDMTRRKQLEDDRSQAQLDLRESQELFSTFMDNLPVPAFIHDGKNKNLYVNGAFEQMFGPGWNGTPAPELMQQDIAKMFFPESSEGSTRGPQFSEHQFTGPDGVTRAIHATTFPIPRQGKPGLLGGYVHDISEFKNIQKKLEVKSSEMERLANMDSLSGLYNRRYFDNALEREFALAEFTSLPLAIGMLDIDHFKAVNDSYGHLSGDEVIREVAARILGSIRSVDIAGRVGGEEFMIIFPRTQLDDAWNVLERLRQRFEKEAVANGINITISGGVIAWQPGDTPVLAVDRVDKLLYQAKQSGRNRVLMESVD